MENRSHAMIDANINRFKEGARVLEDIARFVLADENLFLQIKALKHSVKITEVCRQAEDIGGPTFSETQQRVSLLEVVHANALRMQEAARVLEEMTDRAFYKSLRFESYKIHALIVSALNSYLKREQLNGIYPICDPELLPLAEMAAAINQTGLTLCQLRMKHLTKRKMIEFCQQFKALLQPEVVLIVNDYVDIALACADGVHLGQNDFPLDLAKKITPDNFIVGVTCHTLQQAQEAEQAGASYIAVGCLFPTTSKQDPIPVQLSAFQQIVVQAKIPVCAIGGINSENLAQVSALNPQMYAMQSALWRAPDPQQAIQGMKEKIYTRST